MRFLMPLFSLLFSLLLSFSLMAAFEATTTLGSKSLLLNGVGTRKATFLKIKVYDAALYLEKKEKDSAKVLASTENKVLKMNFLRSVEAKDIKANFSEGLKNNSSVAFDKMSSALDELCQFFGNPKEGETFTLSFYGHDKLEIGSSSRPGQSKVITNKDFVTTFLTIWLGKNPPNEDLKTGLLGL